MTTPANAVRALRAGGVVVIPTDTVYGVAADARHEAALAAIFELKGRERAKALPVLGADAEQLEEVVVMNELARRLAARFWPGPLTLVLPRGEQFTHDLGGNRKDTVAVRVPRHELALEVLQAAGPLAVTSANLSGDAPAHTVDKARHALGDRVEVYLDGGICDGEVSTVASLENGLQVLRQGAVAEEELQRALGA